MISAEHSLFLPVRGVSRERLAIFCDSGLFLPLYGIFAYVLTHPGPVLGMPLTGTVGMRDGEWQALSSLVPSGVRECSTDFPAREVAISPAARSTFVCPETVAALIPSWSAICVVVRSISKSSRTAARVCPRSPASAFPTVSSISGSGVIAGAVRASRSARHHGDRNQGRTVPGSASPSRSS